MFTQGQSGNVKGRPRGKEPETTKTSSPVNRDRKASDARSTVGQVGHTVHCDPNLFYCPLQVYDESPIV